MLWHRGLQLIGAVVALQTLQVPAPPRGFGTSEADVVVDSARVLSPDAIALINRIAFDVHAKSGGEIAVVTLPDIGDRAESDVALQIGRQWGLGAASAIGQRTRNAGAVILLVPKETSADGQGKCWVSTGRGAEGFITDGDAGSICREAAQNFFRQRDYSSGVALVALRTAQEFAREFSFTLDTALAAPQLAPRYSDDDRYSRGGGGGLSPFAIFAIVIIVWVVLSSLRGGRRGGCGGCLPIFIPMGGGPHYRGGGGSWGGGGFGGGGGGFGGFGGGGGFSGGGGGSRW